jgi:RNA 2',3'-cyclic 3'-phosphodiesterase
MAKERLKSPRTRLFVALDLSESVRRGLVEWGGRELTDPALRPVRPEALHVTLAFLGWKGEKERRRAAEIVNSLLEPAPLLELCPEPVALPRRGRDKSLFAIEARSPEAASLQSRLEEQLVDSRLYVPEKRPFWPHVTVARVRREKGGRNRHRPVERPPGPVPHRLLEPFRAVRVTLYRSILRSSGAEYDPLAQVELPSDHGSGEVNRTYGN